MEKSKYARTFAARIDHDVCEEFFLFWECSRQKKQVIIQALVEEFNNNEEFRKAVKKRIVSALQ